MADRTTLNISLPESLRAWVEQQVEKGGYGSASEFIREVLRNERKRVAREDLEELLMEGLRSGPAVEMTEADWDQLKARVRSRITEQRKKTG